MSSNGFIMWREWAMPNSETFSIPVLGAFVSRHLLQSICSVDCFSRNRRWATWTNDLNPQTEADWHMDVLDFLKMLREKEIRPDLVVFDPPYSPRQVQECYEGIGQKMSGTDALRTASWGNERDVIAEIGTPDMTVLSFGWNSTGMGSGRGFQLLEIGMVNHGSGHNDTICMAERRIQPRLPFGEEHP